MLRDFLYCRFPCKILTGHYWTLLKDIEIKALLKQALTDQIDDRALFMKGIDVSYHYEGYSQFKTEEL